MHVAKDGHALESELFHPVGALRRPLALSVSGGANKCSSRSGKYSKVRASLHESTTSSICQRNETVDIHGNATGPVAAAPAGRPSTPSP
ncbi:unnamed protein product [Ectocarpus sp. 12 AP-2014]